MVQISGFQLHVSDFKLKASVQASGTKQNIQKYKKCNTMFALQSKLESCCRISMKLNQSQSLLTQTHQSVARRPP